MTGNDARTLEPRRLMAAKVLLQAPVTGTAKAVGGRLLDHVNWKSLRCDPSLHRLCTLTGFARSTVQLGIRRLVDDGIISIRLHGGRSASSQYDFEWVEIRRRDEAMQEAFKAKRSPPENRRATGPGTRAQTLSGNPNLEPGEQNRSAVPDGRSSGQGRKDLGTGNSRSRSPNRGEVAWDKAQARWHRDLHARFGADKQRYSEIVDETSSELNEEATLAELCEPGTGLKVLLSRLGSDHGDGSS